MNDSIPGLEEPEGQMVLEAVVPQQEDNLTTILNLCRRLVELNDRAYGLTQDLTEVTEAQKDIAEKRLPILMDALGLNELKLNSGQTIRLKTDYFASAAKSTSPEALAWLGERNMDGIVKSEVIVSEQDMERLEAADIPFEVKSSIHPSTLKAFVKERIESGEEFPQELFGVFVADKAVVK